MKHKSFAELVELKVTEIERSIALHEHKVQMLSYSNGKLGLALFYLYYGSYKSDSNYADKAEYLFLEVYQNFGKDRASHSHFFNRDILELATFIDFVVENQWFDLDVNAFLTPFDEFIDKHLLSALNRADFDTFSGVMLAAQYYLLRLKHDKKFESNIKLVLEMLENHALGLENAQAFWEVKFRKPQGEVFLGISHGVSSVLLWLVNVFEKNIAKDSVESLMNRVINFLLKQEIDFEKYQCFFPNVLDEPLKPSRLCLCYGDLGIAYAILRASKAIHNAPLYAKAIKIIQMSVTDKAMQQQKENSDAGILYGASGLCLLYDQIFAHTNDELYKKQSDKWLHEVISRANKNNDFAGYEPDFNKNKIETHVGFFEGISGIACTLLRGIDNKVPHPNSIVWLT